MIAVLTGGTGGAKFVQGLAMVLSGQDLACIVNTGDDLVWWGLHVSPDVDSITYALSGLLSRERGWGVEGDTFQCLDSMKRLGAPAWFGLGDRDLAMHLRRTQLLEGAYSLTQATSQIVNALGISARILPMTDDRVETRVDSSLGELSFQEYFVRERWKPEVQRVWFRGAEEACPSQEVLNAIQTADAVLLAPSNPITSIGPILAVPCIRKALQETKAPIAAVSPIVGQSPVSGPAGLLMKAHGLEVSVSGVAAAYHDFLDLLFVNDGDEQGVREDGVSVVPLSIIMKSDDDKRHLATSVLEKVL